MCLLRVLLPVGFLITCACTRDRCRADFEREEWAAAAKSCAESFEKRGSIEAGVRAAQAERKLGQHPNVIAWAERLGDDPRAASAWRGAAAAHAALEQQDRARAAHVRASLLYEKAGEPGEASYHAHEAMQIDRLASRLLDALEQAERAYDLAARSNDAEMRLVSFTSLFTMLHDVGDFGSARALLRRTQAENASPDGALSFYFRFYEGLLHHAEQRMKLAAAAYRSALKVHAGLDHPRPDILRAIRLNLIVALIELGDLDGAREILRLAEQEAPADRPSHVVSSLAYHAALLSLAERKPEEAERALLPAIAADPIPDWRWRLEHLLGRALRESGRRAEAIRAFERSIETVEAMRTAAKFDDLKTTILTDRRAPYEALMSMHLEAGDTVKALAIAERKRARAFLDAFLWSSTSTAPEDRTLTRARLTALDRVVPALHASPVREVRPIDEVLERIAELDLLAFYEAEGSVHRFQRVAGKSRLEKLDVSRSELAEMVRALGGSDLRPYEKLGRALLGERPLAGGTKPLYVVPDGALARIPFAALRRGGRSLIEERPIVYAPSATALAASLALARTSSDAVVVLGATRSFDPARPPIDAAKDEAELIASSFGARAFVGDRATRDAFRSGDRARVLHVAAHAALSPQGSWLELADGAVDGATILGWRMRPRLAFLATCSSGAPHAYEVSGTLAAALLAAGARTVIATSASIPDDLARRFAVAFYRAGGADVPARAVQSVQREWAKAGRPISEWAPFVVLGLAE